MHKVEGTDINVPLAMRWEVGGRGHVPQSCGYVSVFHGACAPGRGTL